MKYFIIILLILFHPIITWANAYEGKGIGARQIAMGGAAIGLADDWTALYWNPAGLAFQRSQIGVEGHFSLLDQHSRYGPLNLPFPDYKRNNFRAFASDEPPVFRNRHIGGPVLSGDYGLVFGLGKYALAFGGYGSAGTGSDWSDAILATKAWYRMKIMNFNQAFCGAVRLSDRFAVGLNASLIVGYSDRDTGKTHLSVSAPAESYYYRSASRGIGYGAEVDAGLLGRVIPELSLGLLVRSPYLLYSRGTAYLTHTAYPIYPGSSARIPVRDRTTLVMKWFYPVRAGVGAAATPHPSLTVAVDLYWVNWSAMYFDFDYRRVSFYFMDMKVRSGMNDTVQARVGIEWKPWNRLALRAGFYTDPSPYKSGSVSLLTPRFSDAYVVTCGIGFEADAVRADIAYNNVIVMPRRARRNTVGGSVHVISFGLVFPLTRQANASI